MNKATVFQIGNRLAQTMDRRDAFIQAWALVKKGGIELPVNGVSFGNRQTALKRLAKYSPGQIKAVLVAEPENKVDPTAVAVMVGVQNGRGLYRLGYVPRGMTTVIKAIGRQLPTLRVLNGDICGARLALTV